MTVYNFIRRQSLIKQAHEHRMNAQAAADATPSDGVVRLVNKHLYAIVTRELVKFEFLLCIAESEALKDPEPAPRPHAGRTSTPRIAT